VLLSGSPLGRPYGDPVYEPVVKAAAEAGLPLDVHVGHVTGERNPGGRFTSNQAAVPLAYLDAMHHVTSFIVHGTFERYPDLKVVVKEHGVSWLPHLMWRLDANYELLKLESRWVKKPPSEYIYSNVRLDTQPFEESSTNAGDVTDLLTSVDGLDDLLMFATDYPHLSFDDPNHVVGQLPDGWARKVMCDNACAYYGFEVPPADAVYENPSLIGAEA
jgi:predicted TIM-barrel fold metal-dependent hydrolase